MRLGTRVQHHPEEVDIGNDVGGVVEEKQALGNAGGVVGGIGHGVGETMVEEQTLEHAGSVVDEKDQDGQGTILHA